VRAWEALWDYAGAILAGGLRLDADGLRDALEARQRAGRRGSAAAVLACYDASALPAVMEAWGCYAPLLPKSTARRGLPAMLGITPGAGADPGQAAARGAARAVAPAPAPVL
jgi:hypothetical protein